MVQAFRRNHRLLKIKDPDAESVAQAAPNPLLTFSERVINLKVEGIRLLSLTAPYAIMFVTFGDF